MPPIPSPAARLRKVAAVVSSVVLVALFIAYRSGGQTTRALPGSKSALVVAPTTANGNPQASTGPATVPFEVFSTSKSGAIVRPEVFGGSKSAAVFTPGDTIPLPTSATQPAATRFTTAPVGKP